MIEPNPHAVERLERIRRGELPCPPMWETVPLALEEIAPGRVRMRTEAGERHINALGTVHGGFVATALDTVLGLAVYISIDEAARHTTVDLAVKLVKRVPLDLPLVVEATLVHVSRSIGVSQGVLRHVDGTVYAHGTTTCHIRR